MNTTTDKIEVGLATYRAIVALFGDAEEFLKTATHPEDIALDTARMNFVRSARVLQSKAQFPYPSGEARALLAEDFWHWGACPTWVPEFEPKGRNSLVRTALCNIARKLKDEPIGLTETLTHLKQRNAPAQLTCERCGLRTDAGSWLGFVYVGAECLTKEDEDDFA